MKALASFRDGSSGGKVDASSGPDRHPVGMTSECILCSENLAAVCPVIRPLAEATNGLATTRLSAAQLRRRTAAADLIELPSLPSDDPSAWAPGQARALAALQLALALGPNRGHVFVAGAQGCGRHAVTQRLLSWHAQCRPAPSDVIYVNRFDEPNAPKLLLLPAGEGKRFVPALKRAIERFAQLANEALTSDAFKARILEVWEAHRQRWSENPGFSPAQAAASLDEALHEIERAALEPVVAAALDPLRQAFSAFEAVRAHLDALRDDWLDGAQEWLSRAFEASSNTLEITLDAEAMSYYEAHLLVSHDPAAGAPVVHERAPSFASLRGWIESEVIDGERVMRVGLMRAGAIAHANGGFLILDAEAVLAQPDTWEALKPVLQAQRLDWSPPPEMQPWGAPSSLKPDPLPVSLQVVMVGTMAQYEWLCAFDEDFADAFTVVAEFDTTMPRSADNERHLAALVAQLGRERGFLPASPAALALLMEESARAAEHAERLSLIVRPLTDLMAQAEALARQAGAESIDAEHLSAALAARQQRTAAYIESVYRAIAEGELAISTEGARIGQVNGLVVVEVGQLAYGHPVRLTATVRLGGEGEVLDIERETELGGPIHSKGVLILSAFLAGRFGWRLPLALSANLVIEQSYVPVEGDSASLAEACALLSAIARVPLAQAIAVTGSINQFGETQAVGAINEKIESWFEVCAARGLTGRQGVIIPTANRRHLMLAPKLVEAVAAGQFHVWAVQDIDSALALLTGLPAQGPRSLMARVGHMLRSMHLAHEEAPAKHRPWQRRKRD